eukprot:TRINITY_DN31260_c0_g1_i1.p1 TRINITY_DN31260_c0_g1~~TRINITY_DN31260_c0_g1_i1.p1  ORF type:complete len:413 (-),score=93.97 TRINITY_DN31260_c0_g1_i1:115-1353(-)
MLAAPAAAPRGRVASKDAAAGRPAVPRTKSASGYTAGAAAANRVTNAPPEKAAGKLGFGSRESREKVTASVTKTGVAAPKPKAARTPAAKAKGKAKASGVSKAGALNNKELTLLPERDPVDEITVNLDEYYDWEGMEEADERDDSDEQRMLQSRCVVKLGNIGHTWMRRDESEEGELADDEDCDQCVSPAEQSPYQGGSPTKRRSTTAGRSATSSTMGYAFSSPSYGGTFNFGELSKHTLSPSRCSTAVPSSPNSPQKRGGRVRRESSSKESSGSGNQTAPVRTVSPANSERRWSFGRPERMNPLLRNRPARSPRSVQAAEAEGLVQQMLTPRGTQPDDDDTSEERLISTGKLNAAKELLGQMLTPPGTPRRGSLDSLAVEAGGFEQPVVGAAADDAQANTPRRNPLLMRRR